MKGFELVSQVVSLSVVLGRKSCETVDREWNLKIVTFSVHLTRHTSHLSVHCKFNKILSSQKSFEVHKNFPPCKRQVSPALSLWLETSSRKYLRCRYTFRVVLNIFIWIWILPGEPVFGMARRERLPLHENSEWKLLIIGINKMKFHAPLMEMCIKVWFIMKCSAICVQISCKSLKAIAHPAANGLALFSNSFNLQRFVHFPTTGITCFTYIIDIVYVQIVSQVRRRICERESRK